MSGAGAKWKPRVLKIGLAVTVIASFYGVENYRGAKAWGEAKEAFLASGHSLDWEELWPEREVPDHENFAAIDLLRGLTIPLKAPGGKQMKPKRRAIRAKFGHALGKSWYYLTKDGDRTYDDPSVWRDFLIGLEWEVPADEPNDARAVLMAIEAHCEGLKELDRVAFRPKAKLLPSVRSYFDPEQPLDTFDGYTDILHNLTQLLSLRAQAAIHCGERESAKRSLASGFRLTEAVLRAAPTISNQLSAGSLLVYTMMTPIRNSLHSHLWEEADLLRLEHELAAINLAESLSVALSLDNWRFVTLIDQARNSTTDKPILELGSGRLWALAPRGWWDQNKAFVVQTKHKLIDAFKGDASLLVAHCERIEKVLYGYYAGIHPHRSLAFQIVDGDQQIAKIAKSNQVLLAQARIACMLERYHLQHQRYPESLAALDDTIPADPMGKPWRYSSEANGATYTLYSVGWNLTDEGGLVTEKERWQGDWVWGKR